MYVKEGNVHCWDISHIMVLLREHNRSQLIISRAIRFHHHITNLTEPNPYLDSLIDDFICYSINSFQEVMVAEFNPRLITSAEKTWFDLNATARRELWLMLRPIAYHYAGSMINYARVGGMIYLYAQTN